MDRRASPCPPRRRTSLKAVARLALLIGASSLGVVGGKNTFLRDPNSAGSAGSTSDVPSSGDAPSSSDATSSSDGPHRTSSPPSGSCTPRGEPCVFPFRYGFERTLYHECTTVDSDDGEPWCGTTVDVSFEPSTYGRCVECPLTTTTPSTTPGATTTGPVVWLSLIGGRYYINLPVIDNWAMYGMMNTTWTKLRILGTPHLGDGSATVDLHDWTYTSTTGEDPSTAWSQVEWGIAGACQGESEMHVNLLGTPFAYEAGIPVAEGVSARGSVTCSRDRQTCAAHCGGWCGFCGLGEPGITARAQLEVVDRELFDAALWHMFDAAQEALQTTTFTGAAPLEHRRSHTFGVVEEDAPGGGWSLFSGIVSCVLVAVCCATVARLSARGGGKLDGSSAPPAGYAAQFVDFLSRLRRPYGQFNGDDSSPAAATPAPKRATSLNSLRGQPRVAKSGVAPRTIGT